ncbi:MAG: quercetin 2,3-dioxygenase [Egibacteraceae bacterium]
MDVDTTRPYHLRAGEGRAVWHLGALLSFNASGEDTGGRCWANEQLGPRGMAPPRHVHSREDEAFYVLEGELTFYVGEDTVPASAGSFLWAPRHVPHAFCVESAQARFLAFATPAGFEHFFFATGEPATALTTPPPPSSPPDLDALVAALAGYGVEVVGPPPTPR